MKRAYGDDESRGRDRTADVKRQRHADGQQQRQQQRYHPQQQSHQQYHPQQQQRSDSYSRRDERYMPPRSSSSSYRDNTRRDEGDTPTPHERRASAYERGRRSNDSSSYVRPTGASDDSSVSASSGSTGVKLLSETKEDDPHRLAQRQKQIDYGKNTVGYDLYCAAVPKHQRRKMVHPMTPDKTLNVSKKAFDGMIRKWRQALHKYDPPELQDVKEEAQSVKEEPPANMEVSSQPTSASGTAPRAEAVAFSTSHDDDMADLDSERYSSTTSSTATSSAPTLSIYENFVEGDMDDDDDDDDDDDLL